MKSILSFCVIALSFSSITKATGRQIQLDELDSAVLYHTLEEAGVLVQFREDKSVIQTGPVRCKNSNCEVEKLMILNSEASDKVLAIFVENKIDSKVSDIRCSQTFNLSDAPNCKFIVKY